MKNKIILKEQIILENKFRGIKLNLAPGVEYLLNNDFVKVLQRLYGSKIKSQEELNWITPIPIRQAKNILIYRPGGIGDILFILPHLKTLKEINPDCKITFATTKENFEILNISNYIDYKLEDPMEYQGIISMNFDKILLFDKFIEENPEAEYKNAFDIATDLMEGIEFKGLDTTYNVNKPIGNKIHIALSFKASARIRDISPAIWFSFLNDLDHTTYRVTVVIPPEKVQDGQQLIKQTKKFNKDLEISLCAKGNLRELMRLLLETDRPHIGIGPDSGIINLLGYHGIPVIGIFGPFDSILRLKYYKHAIGIDMNSNCPYGKNNNGSCFMHGTTSCHLALYKNEIFSPCIHQLDTDNLIYATEQLVEKVYNNTN